MNNTIVPDTWINLYPSKTGRCYWTAHESKEIAQINEEPGAIIVAMPCCWKNGNKPTPGNPFNEKPNTK